MFGFDVFAIVIVALAILILFASVKTVSQGYNWTVERFGKYTRTLQPGLTLIAPFIDRIGRKMNMMEQVIDIPQQDVISKDNATVTVDGLAFFQVFDAAKASYEVAYLDQAIVKLTMTNIRSVMGGMDLDQMLSHRDEINERLLRVVDAAVSPWGVKVNRIEIKDIVPPADLVQAMGRQMKAEREKRAVILEAEGQRQSAILKAEGQKQSQILEAEGRREAAFRDAEARERSAQAEAKATEMVSEAVARGDIAALNYFVAEKYLKAFGQLAQSPNQKVLMLPIEAMNVLGSLAGIGEIAKATFGGDGRDGAMSCRRGGQPVRPRARASLKERMPCWRGSFHSAPGTGSSWRRCCCSSKCSRPACSCCGSDSPRSWSESSRAPWSGRGRRSSSRLPCSRSHPFRPGGISPARSRSPATARSSIAVPTAMLGESSRSIARSSMAPAPFTSTTPSGASPVPTAPPAAACGSHAPTARTCQSSAINDQATPARNKSWKFTMPTGLPASATINAVIFEELMISSASLAS
jgi:regulator of protease activity HflC (stomatin/prohibitin superfamily)